MKDSGYICYQFISEAMLDSETNRQINKLNEQYTLQRYQDDY